MLRNSIKSLAVILPIVIAVSPSYAQDCGPLFSQDTLYDCQGENVQLLPIAEFDSYQWSTGSTGSSETVSQSGWYSLTVTDALCNGTDSVFVNLLNGYIVQGDQSICIGESVNLNAEIDFSAAIPDPDGFVYGASLDGHYYFVHTSPRNWFEARDLCAQAGGHLITINSAQENALANSLINYSEHWIGQTDELVEGSWAWITGEPVTYTNWAPSEPNNLNGEDYQEMYVNGQWNDLNGSQLFPFILEFDDLMPVSVLWSNGDTDLETSYSPLSSGYVSVQFFSGGLVCSDSIFVEVQEPQFAFPLDTLKECYLGSFELLAPDGYAGYVWSTGSTESTTIITESGTYWLTVQEGACSVSDTIVVELLNSNIVQNDVLICLGESALLSAESNPLGGGGPIAGLNFGGELNGTYYYTSQSSANWTNASNLCSQNGGNLATIASLQEQQFVASLLPGQPQWIGFTDQAQEGNFQWVTGEPVLYTNWGANEPNNAGEEDFAQISPNGQWNDLANNTVMLFVCEFSGVQQVDLLWSTGETTQDITVQPSETTTYFLQVSNGDLVCSDSVVVEVQVASWSFPEDSVFVCGPNAVLDAGEGLVSFLWNTGATTQTIVVDEPGLYSLTVNEGACISSDELELFLLDPSIEQNDQSICLGESVNLSTAVQSLGSGEPIAGFNYGGNFGESSYYVATYSANWVNASAACVNAGGYLSTIGSSQEQSFVFNLLPGQSQWIGFTDAASEGTWVWANGDPVTYTFWNSGEPNNSGNEDYAHMNTNGTWNDSGGGENYPFVCEFSGTFGVDILWSTGDTTQAITVSPGSTETYYVTVSDGIQICTDSITITVETPVFFFPEDTLRICGFSAILDAGGPFDTYAWSTGESSQSIEVSESGVYSVSVDEGACISSGSVVVSIISAEILQPDTFLCAGAQLLLETGLNQYNGDAIPGYSYGGSLNNNHYYLSNSALNAPQAIDACAGLGGYLVSIASSQENQFVASLLPGTDLWIGFTDVAVEGQFQWVSGDPVTYTNWGPTEPNNSGGEDYTHLTPTQQWNDLNGSQVYRYVCEFSNAQSLDVLWSTGETTADITVQPSSYTEYWVQISDGIGTCSDTVAVDVLALPVPDIGMDTMVVCVGDSLVLSANLVTDFYAWNTGGTSETEVVNSDGTYWVEVTDGFGCPNRDTVFVHFFVYPAINYRDTVLCAGDSLELIVDAGNWIIEWSSGELSSSLWVNPEDDSIYTYSINDGIGVCSDSAFVAVSEVLIELLLQEPTCYNYFDGSAEALLSGGFAPYETEWSHDPSALAKGYYELLVSDSIGCTADTLFFLGEPAPLCFLAVVVGADCSGVPGYAVSAVSGGTAPYTEDWGGENPAALLPGTYEVLVSDSQGCITQGQVTMPESDEICGCTYENAANYNPLATVEDGSCIYTCQADLNNDSLINTADLLLMLVVFGTSCE